MTQDEVCALVSRLGGKEYPDVTKAGARCFQMPLFSDAPNCALNDKPPGVHIQVPPDWRHPSTGIAFPGGVEFVVFGEAGDGRWLRAIIHSVKREEVEEVYPSVEAAARAVWCAFVEAMKPREHLSLRCQEQDES